MVNEIRRIKMAGVCPSMKVCYLTLFILLLYFISMDIALLVYVQEWIPYEPHKPPKGGGFSPFQRISVKQIMIDHMTSFIHEPCAEYFEIIFHFSYYFSWVTPNMVSIFHFFLALVACKLISGDQLFWRQIGVILFEMRTWLDSLDGVIYRARSKDALYTSGWGTLGYKIDAAADILAGLGLYIAICYHLYRNPPDWLAPSHQPSIENGTKSSNGISSSKIPPRTLGIFLFFFGLRFLLTANRWDHFVHRYHDLLEAVPGNVEQQALRTSIAHSAPTLIIWWLWRVGNSSAYLEILAAVIFLDKLWDFIRLTHYLGWVFFIVLLIASQIHTYEIESAISAIQVIGTTVTGTPVAELQ